jgi:hypothetical protein
MSELVARLMSILIAVTFPFLIIQFGDEQSLSAYWNTPAQPLFIIMNAVTSYFLFSMERWQFSAILLLLLTAFNFHEWPVFHNILAVTFFIVSTLFVALGHRFTWYTALMIIGGIVAYHDFLIGEIICVELLCAYHLHLMLYRLWLLHRHKKHAQLVGR